MTLAEIRASCRKKTKTNASNYPNEELDVDIHNAYGKVWLLLQEAEGYRNTGGDFEVIDFESETGLTEQDLGYNGEYPMPVGDDDDNIPGAIQLLEAHIKYRDNDYRKAEIINRSDLRASMFSDDSAFYSELSPKVFVYRDSYVVRPKNTGATVEDGIKLLTLARNPELREDDDEPAFEKNLHELIPYYVAMNYFEIYPEKYNPRIEVGKNELESQAISLYESRVPKEKRLKTVKEKY